MARELTDAEVFGTAPSAEMTDADVGLAPRRMRSGRNMAADTSRSRRSPGPYVRAAERTPGERFADNVEDGRRRGTLAGAAADALAANLPGSTGEYERYKNRDAAETYAMRSKADPWHEAGDGLLDKAVAGAATLGGQIVGAVTSPESWIGGPGKGALVKEGGKQVAKRVGQNMAVNAGVAGATDPVVQALSIEAGAQDTYDAKRTLASAAVGAALPPVFEAVGAGGRAAVDGAGAVSRRVRPPRSAELTDAEVFGTKAPDIAPEPTPTAPRSRGRGRTNAQQPTPAAAEVMTPKQASAIVREILPDAVITSGYRDPAKNAKVGGAKNSYHTRGAGQALDIVPPKGVTLEQFRAQLEGRGVRVAELLDEGDHWHVAWATGPARAPDAARAPASEPFPDAAAESFDAIPEDPGFTVDFAKTEAQTPADAQPAKPAAGPVTDAIGAPAPATRVGERPSAASGRDFLDDNHARLYDLGKRAEVGELDQAEAAALAKDMGRLMDWSDEGLSPRERDAYRRGGEINSRRMVEVAKAFARDVDAPENQTRAVSYYDPDAYSVALASNPTRPQPTRAALDESPLTGADLGRPSQVPVQASAAAPERLAMRPTRGELSDAEVFGTEKRAAVDFSAYNEAIRSTESVAADAAKSGLRAAPRPGAVLQSDAPGGFAGQTVSQLAQRLRSTLGITHRQGRMTLKGGAVGEFDPKTAVVRTKAVQELDVLSHEATHALEHKAGPALRAVLTQHEAELRTLAYPGANPAHMREEGFAEFGRWYFTNPDHARRIAPGFYDAFERAMERDNPKAAAEMREIQTAYQATLKAASLDVAAASVAHTGNPGLIGRTSQALRERGFGGVVQDLADSAYTAVVDDLHPLAVAVRNLQALYAENTGGKLDLAVAKNPYALARLARDSYAAGHTDLMQGVVPYRGVDPAGASLAEALETALGSRTFGKWPQAALRRFDAYLISRRMVHEWDRFAKGELPNPPDRNSREFHEAVIADAERTQPQFKAAADQVYEWNQNLWRKEFEAGLITRESYEHGLTAHPDYVPLMRDVSDKGAMGRGRPRGAMQFAGGVKAFEGSSRDVISPLSSMMRRSYELNAIIKRNDALKALDDLAEAAGPGSGAIVERLPAKEVEAINVDALDALQKAAEAAGVSERDLTTLMRAADAALDGETTATVFKQRDLSPKKGEAVVFVWRDGKKTPLLLADGQFGQDMYTALTGLTQDMRNGVVDALAAGSQLLRYGVTLSPEFMSRNFVRDQLATWINTDVGFVPVVDAIRGAKAEVTQNALTKRYAAAGGMRGGANVAATSKPFPKSDAEALAQLQHLRRRGWKVRRYVSWRGLAEFTDLSETASRLGVFRRAYDAAKKRGLDDYSAVTEAAYVSRDYLDFGRRGARMISAVRIVTFLNASLQSLDKSARVLSAGGNLHKVLAPFGKGAPQTDAERRALAHAYKAWAKVATLGLLGLSLRALYADDPEYEEIGDQLRATHWVAKAHGHWVFIPKPFELATLSNIFERAYEAGALKDPTAWKRLASDFSNTIMPPHETPTVAVPLQIAANRDHTGRPIVPDHLRGTVDPHLQFSSYTSHLGKLIGKGLKVAPAVVDHVITGFGGSLGRYVLQGTNLVVEHATGAPKTAAGPEDLFLSRGFVRDVTRGSTSQQQFWKLVGRTGGKLTQATGSLRTLMKEGADDAKTAAYLNSLPPSTRAYVRTQALSAPGLSKLHPIARAQAAVAVLGDLRQGVRDGKLTTLRGEPIELTPQQRRRADDALADLALVEMRTALTVTGVRGWEQKEILPRRDALSRLRAIEPRLGALVSDSYNLEKVPTSKASASFWERSRSRLEARVETQAFSRELTVKRLTGTNTAQVVKEASRLRQDREPNALRAAAP